MFDQIPKPEIRNVFFSPKLCDNVPKTANCGLGAMRKRANLVELEKCN